MRQQTGGRIKALAGKSRTQARHLIGEVQRLEAVVGQVAKWHR